MNTTRGNKQFQAEWQSFNPEVQRRHIRLAKQGLFVSVLVSLLVAFMMGSFIVSLIEKNTQAPWIAIIPSIFIGFILTLQTTNAWWRLSTLKNGVQLRHPLFNIVLRLLRLFVSKPKQSDPDPDNDPASSVKSPEQTIQDVVKSGNQNG